MSTRLFLSKFGQLETFGTISEVEANLMDLDDIKILRSRDFLKMYCELQNWGLRQQWQNFYDQLTLAKHYLQIFKG